MEAKPKQNVTKLDQVFDATMPTADPERAEKRPRGRPRLQDRPTRPTDAQGRTFDPALHRFSHGKPLVRDGRLVMRRGPWAPTTGPQRSRVQVPPKEDIPEPTPTAPPAVPPPSSAQVAGHQIAEAIITAARLLGGEEFEPIRDEAQGLDERKQLRDSWALYCEAKGIEDVPPGIAVSIATVGYLAARLVMPRTKGRLGRAKDWTVTRWRDWKTKAT